MFWALLLAACSTISRYEPDASALAVSRVHIDLDDTVQVQQILNQQYQEWRDVRHLMGGTSRKGIDCSGLVYLTYRTKLGIEAPRSTDQQSNLGRAVRKDQLRAGDLVFFKTGIFSRHVGMYIEGGDFIHVSTSKGVMISNLDDSYWKRRYWKARRVKGVGDK